MKLVRGNGTMTLLTESLRDLEIMEPFNLREVSSLMVCHVFRELPLD